MLNLNDYQKISRLKLFSINTFNVFSLLWQDYGFNKFSDPQDYIRSILAKNNFKPETIDDIMLITMPKFFGLAFNPVSFWLCFKKDELYVVLAEVNNTFGERHTYLCFNDGLEPIKPDDSIYKQKLLHVSPFCPVEGSYQFRFAIDENKVQIDIDYYCNQEKLMSTTLKGKRHQISDKNLLKYIFISPLMSFKVISLIHYHAFWLWVRKIRYFAKPTKPEIDIS